jgi:hypothetical protein
MDHVDRGGGGGARGNGAWNFRPLEQRMSGRSQPCLAESIKSHKTVVVNSDQEGEPQLALQQRKDGRALLSLDFRLWKGITCGVGR